MNNAEAHAKDALADVTTDEFSPLEQAYRLQYGMRELLGSIDFSTSNAEKIRVMSLCRDSHVMSLKKNVSCHAHKHMLALG